MMCAVAVCASLCSQAIAEEQPKAKSPSRVSCTVVRYYVAQYTAAVAEAWARGKGATNAETPTREIGAADSFYERVLRTGLI
jgi:hypothetical protein